MNKELFDRLLLFLSAEFFSDYWHHLTSHHFSGAQRAIIQGAARSEVDAFLDGEESFWNIDFSEGRQEQSMTSFFRRVKRLEADALGELNKLVFSFCADKQERVNITFATGFLHRLAASSEFAREVGIHDAYSALIAVCVEKSDSRLLDTFEVRQAWLQAGGVWDVKIRALTPDLPDYIALDFAECYQRDHELPAFLENLSTLTDAKERKALISEISRALSRQFPPDSDLQVPRILS